jgi:hypothetical protein
MDPWSDLIQRAQSGEEATFRELVDAHLHELHLDWQRSSAYGRPNPARCGRSVVSQVAGGFLAVTRFAPRTGAYQNRQPNERCTTACMGT